MSCNAEFKLGLYYDYGNNKNLYLYETEGELSFVGPLAPSFRCKKCVTKNLSWSLDVSSYGTSPSKYIRFEGEVAELGRFYKLVELSEFEYNLINQMRTTNDTVRCKVTKSECGCSKPDFKSQNYFVYKAETQDEGIVHFYFDDDLEKEPKTGGISDEQRQVFNLRDSIISEGYNTYSQYSSNKYLLSPSTVALVLLNELELWDYKDTLQTKLGYFNERFLSPTMSYGYSQVTLHTLADMVKTNHYPPIQGYNGKIKIEKQREKLFFEANRKNQAPKITASFLRKIIEHWKLGSIEANTRTGKFIADSPELLARGAKDAPSGFDISEKPGVLGTLYMMGINRPVHDRPGPNEHYTSSIIESKIEIIENKLGIPSAPPTLLNKARFEKLNITSDKIEFVERAMQNVDVKSNANFTDSKGRNSRYMHPVSAEKKLNCRKY